MPAFNPIPPTRTLIEIADDYSCASDVEKHEFKHALKEVWTSYDNEEIDVKHRPCDLFEHLYQIRVYEEPCRFDVGTNYYINENNVFFRELPFPQRPCDRCGIVKECCYHNDDFEIEICQGCASFDQGAKLDIIFYKLKKRVPPQSFCSYSIKF